MIAAQAMGFVLDYCSPDSAGYQWADFRLAYLTGAALWAAGVAGYAVSRFRARAAIVGPAPVPVSVTKP